MKLSKLMITALISLVVVGFAVFYYIYFWHSKSNYITMNGCISQNAQDFHYSFSAPKEWQQITPNMGCGKKYQNAETYGLVEKKIGKGTKDISQLAIALYNSLPANYDKNSVEYFKLDENLYLEFMRISFTDTVSGREYKIFDSDWQYIKESFKLEAH